jgi:thioesterase domain-containing protein/acyl carrier protein
VDTKSLPKPDGSRPDLGYSLTPPSDDIETQLVQVWETVMDVRPIGVEDNFFDLGGHSLLAVQLFAEMEKAFSKKLPISILLTASTIKEQAAILENGGSDEAWSPLVPVQTEGAQPPLYCIPGRGGNPIRFNDLAKRMGAGQPIYMLQSRGLSGRTNPLSDIRKIAADFVAAIRTVQPNGPYFFLGSSSGGKVAYEMAQQLRAAGEETGLVVMIDTYGPGYPVYLSERSAVIKWTSRRVQQLQKHLGNLKVLSWKERWAYLGRYLKVSGTFLSDRTSAVKVRWDEERLEDLPDELVQVERANVQAARNYKPKPYAGKVVIFRATEQPKGIVEDLTLGWGKIQIADFSVVDVPGHHGSILVEPRVAALAEALNEQIGLVRQGD